MPGVRGAKLNNFINQPSEGVKPKNMKRGAQKSPHNADNQVVAATKKEFSEAVQAGAPGSNIYGWQGKPPKPGYYRQGGTLVWIYETPVDGRIGEAVQG